ncbi:hypothetical protein BN1708_002029, partial [Verticillium longisporum]
MDCKEKSGHITAAQDESILFFDNLFPLKLSFLFRRPWQSDEDIADLLKRFDSSSLGLLDPINLVKKAIPQDIPMKVTEILPRLKDGGVFVKFYGAGGAPGGMPGGMPGGAPGGPGGPGATHDDGPTVEEVD